MTEWCETTIADLASPDRYALATGPFGSAISSKHFVANGVPVLRGSNLSLDVGVRLIDWDLAFLDEAKAATFKRSMAHRGDLVFTCWGTVGQVGLIDQRSMFAEYVVSNKQMKLTPDPSKADSLFLYYLLSSGALVREVQGQSIGAAVPGFNLGQLRAIRLHIPPVDVQRNVARLLGLLDDLIENNRQRIGLLEQMAQAIYREWFVRLRFPGHEDVPLVDSPLGPIPDGWTYRRLDEVSTLVRGRSYRKSELVDDGGLPFVNLKCMMRGGGFRRDGLKRYEGKFSDGQLVGHGDIVLAVTDLTQGREILARATLVPRLPEPLGVISLDVARIVPSKAPDRLWIFAALRWSDYPDRVKECANGSTVLHLSPDHVAAGLVLWPPNDLQTTFVEAVEPMLGAVDELVDSSDRLASIRDLLLPKLVTGQIDVSRMDPEALADSLS